MSIIKQLNKEHPEKYVMVTRQYGHDIFIAPLDKNLDITVSDKKEDATIWTYADTLSEAKLGYHKAVTGWNGLQFERI